MLPSEAMNDFLSALCSYFGGLALTQPVWCLSPPPFFVYPCSGCICIDGVYFGGIDPHSIMRCDIILIPRVYACRQV